MVKKYIASSKNAILESSTGLCPEILLTYVTSLQCVYLRHILILFSKLLSDLPSVI